MRAAVAIPAPPVAPRPAEPPPPEFTEVAQATMVGLTRLPRGPVLLVDGASRAVYETTPDGNVRPFAALGPPIAEHVQPYMSLTRVVGVWPATVQVEIMYGSRSETYSESFAATVFVFTDGIHPVAHQMPSAVNAIVRGRLPEETLVRCDQAIRRYDPSGWVDVPLPAASEDRNHPLVIDDDATAWLVLGEKLYRASFPALACVCARASDSEPLVRWAG